MGATLDELARGITGAVTRADAKKMARLHGHKWKALRKRMKVIKRGLVELEERVSHLDAYIAHKADGG